jgi:hypothetical protein
MAKYACIKDAVVENVLVFEEFNEELFNLIIEEKGYDELVEASEDVSVGYVYINSEFVPNATPINVPNVIKQPVLEAEVLLKNLGLNVVVQEPSGINIQSVSITSNKLTIETQVHNFIDGDSITVSLLENEDLNGNYEIDSIVDSTKFTVNKTASNLERTETTFGLVTCSGYAGKVSSQSIVPGTANIFEDDTIVLYQFPN